MGLSLEELLGIVPPGGLGHLQTLQLSQRTEEVRLNLLYLLIQYPVDGDQLLLRNHIPPCGTIPLFEPSQGLEEGIAMSKCLS